MREAPILIFSALMVLTSVVISGGPRVAAEIRRDDQRASDLSSLAMSEKCPECVFAPSFGDPQTGRAYVRKTDPDRWCAAMERPQDVRPALRDGCVIVPSDQSEGTSSSAGSSPIPR